MIAKFLNQKTLQLLSMLSAINFNVAVILLLVVSLISAAGSSLIFDNNSELYGPLAGNLRLMLVYLTLSQFSAYCYCSYSENYRLLVPAGLFWLLLMGSIEFYGMVNQIPIDEDYGRLFLYLGLSNLSYGGFMIINGDHCRNMD
ncbi:hypothetical protein [Candidatus Methylobacter oryzae]|uniref:Uncharacterized protein n=1 Tax=Candidatus Methylobacter oryzae TaxID=2497749 RepID=A0ABY3CD69_9GAMM|nr:hypothetical protein [Candidatus Methylobacter oryzae]TRW97089.1 hypothetical protein EKO24_008055 [Candidatus Methylobacter oryzae]